VRAIPRIAYIEADQMGTLATVQNNPPNGLDRTSERLLPLDHNYTYSEGGTGVHVYVIDTGIRATHTDFGGRVSGGVDEVMDGNGTGDCNSHGTHVASPHVAGVAARYLGLHPMDSPAAVLTAIHNNADVTGTPMWAGIVNPGAGSPNELLHWARSATGSTTATRTSRPLTVSPTTFRPRASSSRCATAALKFRRARRPSRRPPPSARTTTQDLRPA
jgi:subtilisin family serine protease